LDTPVVITGLGAVTPLGRSAHETFDALLAGRTACVPIADFPAAGLGCPAAARLAPFSPEDLGLAPRDARVMSLYSFALLAASRAAFAQAGLPGPIDRARLGFFAGVGTVDPKPADLAPALAQSRAADGSVDWDRFFSAGYQSIHPLWPLGMLNNIGHSVVAIDLDVRGDNATFTPHAEAGAHAVDEARRSIACGASVAALAAGASEEVSPFSVVRHARLGWLSPSGCPRPFQPASDGAILGEAASCLVLENASSALQRGSPALAELAGFAQGTSPGGRPSAAFMTNVIAAALDDAKCRSGDVGLVFSSACGAPAQDAADAEALCALFPHRPPVTTTRAALGSTLAAAMTTDLALAALALARKLAPPCGAAGQLNIVAHEPRPLAGPAVLVNVQGLAGQCASAVVRAAGV